MLGEGVDTAMVSVGCGRALPGAESPCWALHCGSWEAPQVLRPVSRWLVGVSWEERPGPTLVLAGLSSSGTGTRCVIAVLSG